MILVLKVKCGYDGENMMGKHWAQSEFKKNEDNIRHTNEVYG